jgi:hypothetical protein
VLSIISFSNLAGNRSKNHCHWPTVFLVLVGGGPYRFEAVDTLRQEGLGGIFEEQGLGGNVSASVVVVVVSAVVVLVT